MAAYRDPNPISPEHPEYDKSKVDPRVANYTKHVRHSEKGLDTREAMARAEEISNITAGEAKEQSLHTQQRQAAVENQFDDVMAEWSEDRPVENAQTIAATTNRNTGENWRTIGRRLDDENERVTSQLAQTDEEIDNTKEKLIGADINYLYVDALATDANDGLTVSTPVRTLSKAFNILKGLGSKANFGVYVIKIKGYGEEHPYAGVRSRDLPYFQKISVEGETDESGFPNTFIEGSTNNTGIWIEPGVKYMDIKNLYFNGFRAPAGNGYGLLMKNQGFLNVENCIANDCDIGFAGINNVTIMAKRTVAQNCTDGYRAQYSSNATFGAGQRGDLYDDGGLGSKALNCRRGVYISRNAVAHVDYMNLEDCDYAGVSADMASRVHVLGSHFKRNDFGVRLEGGAEWINNRDEPNFFYMDSSADKNRVVFGHFGSSRETRLQGQTATNEFRISVKSDSVTKTGNTRESLHRGSDLGIIPAYWFISPAKRIRIVISGLAEGQATKSLIMYTSDIEGGNTATLARSNITRQGSFELEWIIYTQGENTQRQNTKIYYAFDLPAVTTFIRSMPTNMDRYFNLSAEMTNGTSADKITVDTMEIYFNG